LAHWLKGSGGTVGYDHFTKPAETLEACAKLNDMERAVEVVNQIKSLVAAIVPPYQDNDDQLKS